MVNLIKSLFSGVTRAATVGPKAAGQSIWKSVSAALKKDRPGLLRDKVVINNGVSSAGITGDSGWGFIRPNTKESIPKSFMDMLSKRPTMKKFVGVGKVGMTAMKGTLRVAELAVTNPLFVATTATAGFGVGVARTAIRRSEERTTRRQQQGMQPNHLGTDGLTLALSRKRHR